MQYKTLKPVKLKKEQVSNVAKKIIQWQYDFLYKDLFEVLKSETVINDNNTIIQALRSGLLFYQDGQFISSTGRFNNKLALSLEQIGAKYSKFKRAYLLKSNSLPVEILSQLDIIRANTAGRVFLLKKIFDNFIANIDTNIKQLVIDEAINTILLDFQNRIESNMKQKKIQTIGVKFNDFTSTEFVKNYVESTKYSIVGKSQEQVTKMRDTVSQMVLNGKSTKSIEEYIFDNFQVNKRRAKFIARNEIGLTLSAYKEVKYKSEGFRYFKWLHSNDERVRPLHRELGKKQGNIYGIDKSNIFDINNPPMIYDYTYKTGKNKGKRVTQYGLPEQTYGCRCDMEPIYDDDFIKRRKIKNSV